MGMTDDRWEKSLVRKFGITGQQYDSILQKQDEQCAICRRHYTEFPRRLCVDHNHKTGEVRGLLCTNCNYRLVAKHTDGDLLRRIADYVDQGTGWYVPPRPKGRKRRGRNT